MHMHFVSIAVDSIHNVIIGDNGVSNFLGCFNPIRLILADYEDMNKIVDEL